MSRKRHSVLYGTILVLAGIPINITGAWIVRKTGLPVYLDSIGTILASILGGYIPGVITGLSGNIIYGVLDADYIYYSALNIMIALITAWFAWKRDFRRFRDIPLPAFCLALPGGILGAVLTWNLYGGVSTGGTSEVLARAIHDSWSLNVLTSQIIADLTIDMVDKLICLFLAVCILKLLPEQILTFYPRKKQLKKQPFRLQSLKAKVVLVITAAMCVLAAGISYISITQYYNDTLAEYAAFGRDYAVMASICIDPEKVDLYLEEGENAEGYQETLAELQELADGSENIEYLYAYQIREDGCHVVFDTETPFLEGGLAGEVIPFDDSFSPYIPSLLKGEEIDPVVTNDTYGWLLTIYLPVLDKTGMCKCYVAVDISMSKLISDQRVFLTKILSLFLAVLLVILCVVVYMADRGIVSPINAIAKAVGRFAYTDESARAGTVQEIDSLQIRTGDEIENLYEAMNKTVKDTVGYIESYQKQSETLSRMQDNLILVMADLVESRDKLTGDHIKKTAFYVRFILEEMKKKGLWKDVLTDAYMEDVIRSAPLHDIGKITVPDAILNKTGRLTVEEYERMKLHTISGWNIIGNAMEAIDEDGSGYLAEARNMARSHHEKWDGTGYPDGLRGRQIPLSARIMAIADVFDALTSRRSYKEGMSVEKTLSVIESGKGTHFDPEIAQVFLDACREQAEDLL